MKRCLSRSPSVAILVGAGAVALFAQNTIALLNTQYNAESTGNVLTLPLRTWIPAAICNNATPASHGWSFPTSNPGVPACQTGANTQIGTMDFADASDLSAQIHVKLPSDFTSTVDAKFVWFTSATSGDVVWQLATICRADAEVAEAAFNTA